MTKPSSGSGGHFATYCVRCFRDDWTRFGEHIPPILEGACEIGIVCPDCLTEAEQADPRAHERRAREMLERD